MVLVVVVPWKVLIREKRFRRTTLYCAWRKLFKVSKKEKAKFFVFSTIVSHFPYWSDSITLVIDRWRWNRKKTNQFTFFLSAISVYPTKISRMWTPSKFCQSFTSCWKTNTETVLIVPLSQSISLQILQKRTDSTLLEVAPICQFDATSWNTFKEPSRFGMHLPS